MPSDPLGTSTGNVGIYAVSTGSYGLVSDGNGPSTVGALIRGNGGAQAAVFVGSVQVQGNLTITGSFPKSAAVPHPDGSHRRLYCQEAPEPWFEDFGSGQLVQGRATIQLDPDFAAVVHGESYHVFLTPTADCNGLYVSQRTPQGFTVQELRGGTSSLAFSYRLVAKRRDLDHHGRMERVEVHEAAVPKTTGAPTLPAAPPSPTVPQTPAAPRGGR